MEWARLETLRLSRARNMLNGGCAAKLNWEVETGTQPDGGNGKPQGRSVPTEGNEKVRNFTDQLEGAIAARRVAPSIFLGPRFLLNQAASAGGGNRSDRFQARASFHAATFKTSCHITSSNASGESWRRVGAPSVTYSTVSTTRIFSRASRYSTTSPIGIGPYSAETASRISCAFRLPSAKFSTS
jgi:hypothetical protein